MTGAEIALVGSDGDDPGFRRFDGPDYSPIPFNLSETRIWILDLGNQCLQEARTQYFTHRRSGRLGNEDWLYKKKDSGTFRYQQPDLLGLDPAGICDWQTLSKALTADGIDLLFNKSVFNSLFLETDTAHVVETLYRLLLKGRSSKGDRTVGAAVQALFSLQASGAILLPVGWASKYSGIRDIWPGKAESLSALLDPSEIFFAQTVREQLKITWSELSIENAGSTHKKRMMHTYKSLKLMLAALPPNNNLGAITGEMFTGALELLVRMRDRSRAGETRTRDRSLSNFRIAWNAIAPYRAALPSAAQEMRDIRDFITTFVHRAGDAAAQELRRRRRGHQMRKEGDLRWVLEEAEYLQPVVELGREYIAGGSAYVMATLSRGFEKLFEYLIDRPDQITNLSLLGREDFRPGATCCLDHGGFPSFFDYLRSSKDLSRHQNKGSNKGDRSDTQLNSILNSTLGFFEWYRDNKAPAFHVPLFRSDIPAQNRRGWNRGKSNKLPVPVRVLNLCKLILTENDYAWPRSLREDYVPVTYADGTTGIEWCPVRAVAMLMMFTLPLRAVSVRRLDSGEGDELIYDHAAGTWVPNLLPSAEAGRSVGVIQQILAMDANGNPLGGFFINSNKTKGADVKLTSSRGPNKSAHSFGYSIPWNNTELFENLAYCRDWQIRCNTAPQPRGLDEVSDNSMRVTQAVARNLPKFYFLFRDPSAGNDPVSSYKLTAMFDLVMREASRRISEEDGKEINLDRFYTLHCLRVGGITAFAKAGIPLGVLTEFIAGHSTIIMNLYYQRHSAPEISRIINDALAAFEAGGAIEDDLFERVSQIAEDIDAGTDGSFTAKGLAFRHKEALDLLRKAQKGLILIDIDGCCPVGGAMCDLGGPMTVRGETSYNLLGTHGCATCRFHVTGEPFLAGMVIKANETICRLRSMATAIREVEARLADRGQDCEPGPRRVLQSRLDGLNLASEQLMMEWSARVQSILLTTDQLRMADTYERPTDGKALLLAKQYVAFEEGSEFRLSDFLARAANVIQLDPSVAQEVKLRRRVLLDRLLDDNGLKPFLFSLPETAAQQSATKLVDLLVSAVGWDGLDAAMERKSSLVQLGFDEKRLESLDALAGLRQALPDAILLDVTAD